MNMYPCIARLCMYSIGYIITYNSSLDVCIKKLKYITLRRRTQVSNRMQRLTVLKSIRPSPAKHIAHDQKFTRLPCINLNITIQALILFHATFHCQLGPIGSPRALHATHPDQPRTETKNKKNLLICASPHAHDAGGRTNTPDLNAIDNPLWFIVVNVARSLTTPIINDP